MHEIAVRIKRERKRQGLTIEQLAEKADISIPTLSRIERGIAGSYGIDKLDAIVTALDMTPNDLFGEPSNDPAINSLVESLKGLDASSREKTIDAFLKLIELQS